jgi:hypothetical protein
MVERGFSGIVMRSRGVSTGQRIGALIKAFAFADAVASLGRW